MLYGIVGAVILLACILVIYGVFYLSVIGRIHQFGQLRTIGMTKKQMKKLVSREGVALYLRSAPIGILIGGIAGYFIIPNGFNILNTLLIIALVFVVIYIITMISVRKPARLAATVSPMEALRYVPQDGMKKAANKKLCRKLSPMGLGMMNFSKNRKKATITMLSLALGGILFMTAATYISSFDKEGYSRQGIWEDADFNIFYSEAAVELSENGMSEMQAEKPMGDDMVREISAIDGVEKVDELKSLGIIFDFPKNDEYYDGSKMAEKEVTVLGILSTQYSLDNPAINGWFVMPEKPMLNQLSYDSLNSQLLISADSENEASVDEALKGILEKRPELSMEAYVDMKISYEQAANTLFGAISGLAIFIMMFSILSMMNTLITNIVTRKQELAMLESIGMNKDQIRKMLLGESLLLVLATVGVTMTIGTLCGYVLSNILYNTGAFYMAFKFPVSLALIYAVVLSAVPMIITLVSMHSFSKEALVERLRGMEN
ncbi:MAG: ABC transporter permease [Eubacteriales bacterium]|nr:ABC transporter permease [Eubacteriales bacterium]